MEGSLTLRINRAAFCTLPRELIQRAFEGFGARLDLDPLSLFNEEGQPDLVVWVGLWLWLSKFSFCGTHV